MAVLRDCFDRNPDGAGVMYAEDGTLKVAKGFMKWRSLKRYLKRMTDEKKTSLPFVFHFRIATHGSIGPPNCHPFYVHDNMAMMHNGVMSNIPIEKDSDISDSEAFINVYVKGLGYDLNTGSEIAIEQLEGGSPLHDLYDSFIGGSKLLFMDNMGDVAIINESSGYWEKSGSGKGMWFSNRMWKPIKVVPVSRTGSSYLGYNRSGYVGSGYNKPVKVDSTLGKVTPTNRKINEMFGDNSEDYYCFDCHLLFMYSDSKRIHWSTGNERHVCCPDCDSENTIEYDVMHVNDWLGGQS